MKTCLKNGNYSFTEGKVDFFIWLIFKTINFSVIRKLFRHSKGFFMNPHTPGSIKHRINQSHAGVFHFFFRQS